MKIALLTVVGIFFGAALIPLIWAVLTFFIFIVGAVAALTVACPIAGFMLIGVGAVVVLSIIGLVSLFRGSGNSKETGDKK